MAEKCGLCGKEIEETFLKKIRGSIIKINKSGKNEFYYVCSECQKEHGDKIKEKIGKNG